MATIKIESHNITIEARDVPEPVAAKIYAMLAPNGELQIRQDYESGALSKIAAIKVLREYDSGLSLKAAKDQVETWAEPRNVS